MNLDRVRVVIRPRTAWEGMDLGFAMARQWFLPLWRLWWLGALPLTLSLLLLFPDSPWLVMLLAWWFKPLYEPPLVFWLSRVLFDEQTDFRDVARRWGKIVRPQLLANLTWRRFSPMRSFYMPVALLEGVRGVERRRRLEVLAKRQHVGTWLTVVGLHFEFVLELSFLMLLILLLPQEIRWVDFESLFVDPGPVEIWLQHTVDLLAMSLIAPFYVAGGFALYLTRRSELEGWDIELSFRRLMTRRREESRAPATLPLLLFLLGSLLASAVDQPAEASLVDREQAREIVEEVFAGEEFGRMEKVPYWKFVGQDGEDASDFWDFLLELLDGFGGEIAVIGEILMWLCGGLLLAFLAYHLVIHRGWLQHRPAGRPSPTEPPLELFGLDLRPQSLPRDIPAEASRLLAAERPREALSLLYRGALARLVHSAHLEVPASATEGECVALVTGARPADEASFFRRLTGVWLRLAYGHILPPSREVEALCREWPVVYAEAL